MIMKWWALTCNVHLPKAELNTRNETKTFRVQLDLLDKSDPPSLENRVEKNNTISYIISNKVSTVPQIIHNGMNRLKVTATRVI